MLKVLAPVDGSQHAMRMIDYLIHLVGKSKDATVYLLNVRDTMDSLEVHRFWSEDQIREFQQKEGNLVLQPARERLDAAKVSYVAEVVSGDIASTIAEQAKVKHCDMIVMGTRGHGSIANLIMGSVATKVIHLADMPVTLVK